MFGLPYRYEWRSLPGPAEQRDAAYFGDANGERAGEDDAVEELAAGLARHRFVPAGQRRSSSPRCPKAAMIAGSLSFGQRISSGQP